MEGRRAAEQHPGDPPTATYTDQKDREFASKIGVDRFIIKPQKPEVLADEIKEILSYKTPERGR